MVVVEAVVVVAVVEACAGLGCRGSEIAMLDLDPADLLSGWGSSVQGWVGGRLMGGESKRYGWMDHDVPQQVCIK